MIENLNVFQLLELLSKKPKEEIEWALVSLMISNKIDFVNVNNSDSFNMQMLNEDLYYIGDEKAKEFSWYEKNKKINH